MTEQTTRMTHEEMDIQIYEDQLTDDQMPAKYSRLAQKCEQIKMENFRLINYIDQINKLVRKVRKQNAFITNKLDQNKDDYKPSILHEIEFVINYGKNNRFQRNKERWLDNEELIDSIKRDEEMDIETNEKHQQIYKQQNSAVNQIESEVQDKKLSNKKLKKENKVKTTNKSKVDERNFDLAADQKNKRIKIENKLNNSSSNLVTSSESSSASCLELSNSIPSNLTSINLISSNNLTNNNLSNSLINNFHIQLM